MGIDAGTPGPDAPDRGALLVGPGADAWPEVRRRTAVVVVDGRAVIDVPDEIEVPEDAGEYADALAAILRRIPEHWGRWLSIDAGWYPIIARLDAQLATLDPDYELHQVKEKFGGLRYYTHTEIEVTPDASSTVS